jgi:DNA-binding NtrC family response regulator
MSVRDVVAIVDDEPLVLRALQRILAPVGHRLVLSGETVPLDAWLYDPRLAVVVLDLFMGSESGPERVVRIRRARPDVAVVVMTGRPSIDGAVQCMRAGAFDFLCKPFTDLERVRGVVADARRFANGLSSESEGATSDAPVRGLDWVRVPLVAEPPPLAAAVPLSLEAYERLALERALREASGDAAEAARRLGIGRSTFYRKAAKHGVAMRRIEGPARPEPAPPEPDRARAARVRRVGEGPSIR